MGGAIPFPDLGRWLAPRADLKRQAFHEYEAMELIEQHGETTAAEAICQRNAAWRKRNFDEADRWRAILAHVVRVEGHRTR